MADPRRSKRLRCRRRPAIPILPAEILFEILAWLPAKTILKLKCVCRDWRRLISQENHDLAVEQFRRCRSSPTSSGSISLSPFTKALVYHGFDGTFAQIPLPNLSPAFSVRSIEASSNGLCCLLCSYGSPSHFVYICNPFLPGQGERVPLYPAEESLRSFTPFFFEGNGMMRTLGLAFDPVRFSFKLVQFNCICLHTRAVPYLAPERICQFRIFLYSSDSGRWVESRSIVSTLTRVFSTRVQCWDRFYDGGGKMYWHCERFLVYYDIEGDAAGDIAMPNLVGFHVSHQELELREGRLMCNRMLMPIQCIQVWVLTGDTGEERWECQVRVMLQEVMLKGLKGWLNKVTGEVSEEAWMYEDKERGDCMQVMVHVGEWFPRLQVLHYDIFRKALITQHGRIYENPPSWMINRGLTLRHHGSLLPVPKRHLGSLLPVPKRHLGSLLPVLEKVKLLIEEVKELQKEINMSLSQIVENLDQLIEL